MDLDATIAAQRVGWPEHLPQWAWTRIAGDAIAAGLRAEVRARALDRAQPPDLRALFLRALGAPRDAEMIAAIRELLADARAWNVYAALEGLRLAPEDALVPELRRLLGDRRLVSDMGWRDRISHVAARIVRPPDEWLAARRAELADPIERPIALAVLARLGDPAGLAALAAEPDDPYGEIEALRREIRLTSPA